MSDNAEKEIAEDQELENQIEADQEVENEAGEEAEKAESVEDVLRTELRDLKERFIRQQAEFDNVRKRLRKEMEETSKRAVARFVQPLLSEMDSFDLALTSANPEKFQDFAMGVSMIKENITRIFSDNGVELIPCEGVFNPSVHEVITEDPSSEEPRGTITMVHRQGYKIGDKVIRAAQVVVSGAASEENSEEVPAEESEGVDETA